MNRTRCSLKAIIASSGGTYRYCMVSPPSGLLIFTNAGSPWGLCLLTTIPRFKALRNCSIPEVLAAMPLGTTWEGMSSTSRELGLLFLRRFLLEPVRADRCGVPPPLLASVSEWRGRTLLPLLLLRRLRFFRLDAPPFGKALTGGDIKSGLDRAASPYIAIVAMDPHRLLTADGGLFESRPSLPDESESMSGEARLRMDESRICAGSVKLPPALLSRCNPCLLELMLRRELPRPLWGGVRTSMARSNRDNFFRKTRWPDRSTDAAPPGGVEVNIPFTEGAVRGGVRRPSPCSEDCSGIIARRDSGVADAPDMAG